MSRRSCEGLQLYVDHLAQIEMSKEKRRTESERQQTQRLEKGYNVWKCAEQMNSRDQPFSWYRRSHIIQFFFWFALLADPSRSEKHRKVAADTDIARRKISAVQQQLSPVVTGSISLTGGVKSRVPLLRVSSKFSKQKNVRQPSQLTEILVMAAKQNCRARLVHSSIFK